ncbi:helix-turn-helix domain-containing protein [Umezakia ovalisporum]|uniref:helix-turn-helix domain-containing protein n=1 Tax=Umezakia ovalisporum TaxID=75695 RepID=UPI002474855D|nr:helix-turn-helix domain-containing protein [Umezakia ovalisporum]MDH6087698.1 helix-turn-helix domain-containing protein [Umezakia ovalisporum Ak1311]
MTMTPVYLFTIPGNPSVKISQDELRSLLGEIEAELHSSKVYLRAVAKLKKLLGPTGEQVKILLKAVGREAISLAFQQFAQPEKLRESIQVSPTVKPETVSDSSTSKPELQTTNTDSRKSNLLAESTIKLKKCSETNSSGSTLNNGLNLYKKSNPTQLTKQAAAEQRQEIMCRIGQQLKQAREFQGLSLQQMNIYTHVPIHYMEAIENSKFDVLPEDTLVRGFIGAMGNALGLNGKNLAASLPPGDVMQSILPSWYNSIKSPGGLVMDIRPIHLYVGYTALVSGAVGGLSLISQQAKTDRDVNPNILTSPSLSVFKSSQMSEVNVKPGLNSGSVGSDIAPPEIF